MYPHPVEDDDAAPINARQLHALESPHQRAGYRTDEWIAWLAQVGYGLDVTTDPPPPCSPAALAAEYNRLDPLTSRAEWTKRLTGAHGSGEWSKSALPRAV